VRQKKKREPKAMGKGLKDIESAKALAGGGPSTTRKVQRKPKQWWEGACRGSKKRGKSGF